MHPYYHPMHHPQPYFTRLEEPAPKRPCGGMGGLDITMVQNLLNLQQEIVVFEQAQHAAAQHAAHAAAQHAAHQAALLHFAQLPQAQPMRTVSPPCTHKVRSQPSRKVRTPRADKISWRAVISPII